MSSLLVLVDAARVRVTRFHLPRLGFFGLVIVYIGVSILIGYWAGRVARNKGRDFGIFMTVGFVVSLCGLVPGLVVVLIAYLIGARPGLPAQGAGQESPSAAPPVPPLSGTVTPQPPSGQPPPPPPPAGIGEATRDPDGGYEYTPPPPTD
jgi:hypothetical protein